MTEHSFNHLILESDDDGIALLTINRPDKLNALNADVLDELERAATLADKDANIRALIVTGSGNKAFVAGADIKELRQLNRETGEKLSRKGQNIFDRFEQCSKPTAALVNGYALGGGAELAMACHLRIATENALIGLPEVSLGLIPGYGGTQRLPGLVGKAKAMEMILTGQPVKADEALNLGLVNYVQPQDEALGFTKNLIKKIIKNGPLALKRAIIAINKANNTAGYKDEAEQFGVLCETDDFYEGTTAFIEKRKAEFKGS